MRKRGTLMLIELVQYS